MKRRQPQFDSDKDTKREIASYLFWTTAKHISILVLILLYLAVKYGETVDIICNKFLK